MPPGSPLHWSIRKNNISAVKLLLQNEADVDQLDSFQFSPLQLAIESAHRTELVRELLHAGAGLSDPSRKRIDVMRSAIRRGDLELVKTLAEADPETLKHVDDHTANDSLSCAGSTAVLQYLVSQGSDPFKMQVRNSAVTLLLGPQSRQIGFAINSGLVIRSPEESLVFALLHLAYEADVRSSYTIKRFRRALPIAVFKRIVNKTSLGSASPPCLAASVSKADRVDALITMDTELDSEGCRYGSPLMAACAWGNLDAARVLVRAGALLCYVNEEGTLRNAISAATRHQNVIKWLLVGRYTDQPKIDHQQSQTTAHESVWSGPRLFKLSLPAYMHRDAGESSWSYLQRLQKWRDELRGSALAGSRRDSGLDFYAGFEAESRIRDAKAAHHRFLMKLGETATEMVIREAAKD